MVEKEMDAVGLSPTKDHDDQSADHDDQSAGRIIKKRRLDDRFITITNGMTTNKIGVDADREAIDSAIRSVFGLSKDRVFWLEDKDKVVRPLDRHMPPTNYTLRVDEGVTVTITFATGYYSDMPHKKTFYSDAEFAEFLKRMKWQCLMRYTRFGESDYCHFRSELVPKAKYSGYVG